MKTMKNFAGIDPNIHADSENNVPFRDFFYAPLMVEDLCMINDPTHLVAKMFWRLVKMSPLMGNQRASIAIVRLILQTFGKKETGVDPSLIVDKKDAMNYNRIEKLNLRKLLVFFKSPEHQATRIYLKLILYVMEAYIDPKTIPGERLRKAWYVALFCRFWKKGILLKQETTLKNDFITTNAYACIELNAHGMLKFLITCRELGKPEMFLMHLASSQPCESFFRNLRSMTSTNFTQINFTIFEVLHKVRRTLKLLHTPLETSEDHDYNISSAEKNLESVHIPSSLPNNDDIEQIVEEALNEARKDLSELGN